MLKNALICLLWLLPNIAFATSGSCSNTQLADYLMHEDKSIVSFTVVNSQFSRETGKHFIEVDITREFYADKLTGAHIRINTENGFGPALNTFTKDIEWLTVLTKYKNTYIIAGCAPTLTIEDDRVLGETGIHALNEVATSVSVEMFALALNAFQQGISSADTVCKSQNTYQSDFS